jgi:hypothetical protein
MLFSRPVLRQFTTNAESFTRKAINSGNPIGSYFCRERQCHFRFVYVFSKLSIDNCNSGPAWRLTVACAGQDSCFRRTASPTAWFTNARLKWSPRDADSKFGVIKISPEAFGQECGL